ncbi:MAG TPA: septum formation initiator family protein [Thermoanaerobaculia bacterium]|nr:septum formation initiator family protein [Thermoanaerobaculia bacterium]
MNPAVSAREPRRSTKVTLKVVVLLSSILTVIFLISFVFSEQGISELQRSRATVQKLETDIEILRKENERLEREIESLKSSTFVVERIAREDLGMSREGEIIYMLPPEEATAGKLPPPR